MNKEDKQNIVEGLINSRYRADNEILVPLNRKLANEADAVKKRLARTTVLYGMAISEVERRGRMEETLRNDLALMDMIAREYFINHPEARARWEPRVSYVDAEYALAAEGRELFDQRVDFSMEAMNDVDIEGLDELLTEEDDIDL